MGELNIPSDEQNALKAIDCALLDELIEQCLNEKRSSSLRVFRFESCGPYVATRARLFEETLAKYDAAKAAKKRAETEARACRAGSDLKHAIRQMKQRVEAEERERQLFQVDDLILPPYRFSEHLTVRVSYRWRPTIEDEWLFGSITFSHAVDSPPDHALPLSKRGSRTGKQEQDRQAKLHREWQHLMSLGLHSVREHFRSGGNAVAIPQAFQAKADPYNRGLNNFSARFWL